MFYHQTLQFYQLGCSLNAAVVLELHFFAVKHIVAEVLGSDE
jgi:hypothetical protein